MEPPDPRPNDDRVWVINTPTAADILPQILERFRHGHSDPLIFGDTTQPEAVVIPYKLWQSLDTPVFE